MRDDYLNAERLCHHGYFYRGDPLGDEDALGRLRKSSNMLVFPLVPFGDITPEIVRTVLDGAFDRLSPLILKQIDQRIETLNAMDFVTVGEAPFWPLIRFDRFDAYQRTLAFLKEHVPKMAELDYLYFWDEPDLNPEPGSERLGQYIDAFKDVFPKVKVTTCYAIAQEKFIETVPPDSLDLLMIDPYFGATPSAHTASDFERFYRMRLALCLDWVNRWDKPFLIVGDSFWSRSEEGKRPPSPEASLWYYQAALLQPRCTGLLWFQYGEIDTPENITGVTLDGGPAELVAAHRAIGERILGAPSPLGLPGELGPPPLPEVVKEALR